MADYWTETGKLFGSLIEKPKMTEKLLKKPPPKYIYDIILNTMKKTNFPKGLLTDQEMDHKYFEADPHHKLAILQKVIDITRIVMSENFDIKTTNILKGEQPDKTNYFLQMFYKAATNGKDNTPLIQKYLENKASKETKKKAEPEMPSNFGNESKPKFENPTKTEKPKGMIQDDGADVGNEDDNKNDDIKIGGGIGMKMDKRIFVHEDLTESKSEVKKPRVENVDLEAVKEYVQQITKNCNPLGKLVDSLWDDIESMNKELANWINENKKYKDRYDDEMKKNDDITIGGGIGMKMDKRIFVHEDLTESKSEVKKPRVENVDLEAVKEYVQQITKNCNPLGKLVDSLWDDIESMNKELANWINENKKYKDRYDDEMKKSDETLLPLQNELLELEDSIRDEQTQIKAIKSRLIKNEKIIQNLITNVISFKSDQG